MKKKALSALNDLQKETEKIKDSYTLTNWKSKATNIFIRINGIDCEQKKQVQRLKFRQNFSGGGNNIARIKEQALELVKGQIEDIKRFGPPDQSSNINSGLSINITQSQSQKSKISINLIIESIQEELSGSQLSQLQEIIGDKKLGKKSKKEKIINKIMSFGSDVASNILANILTNPALIG